MTSLASKSLKSFKEKILKKLRNYFSIYQWKQKTKSGANSVKTYFVDIMGLFSLDTIMIDYN